MAGTQTPDEARARRWALICAERDRLLRLSRAHTLNEDEAEDCVQEAMLRCFEFANLDENRIAPFLTTVTKRLCVDEHRLRSRLDRVGTRLAMRQQDEPSPEERICDRAEATWLVGKIGPLSARQRTVVEASAEGLSSAAVAHRFQVSSDAVRSALARARARARVALSSTLGVVWPLVRRPTIAVVGGGAVIVGVTLAPRVADPPRPDSRPVPPVTRLAPDVAVRYDDATASAPVVRALRPPGHPVVVQRRTGPPDRPRPTSEPSRPPPILPVGEGGVGDDGNSHKYTLEERIRYCVKHGPVIDVDKSPFVGCPYPSRPDEP